MTKPNEVQEQLDKTYFIPQHKLAVYFATENFSAVYKTQPTDDKVAVDKAADRRAANKPEQLGQAWPRQFYDNLTSWVPVTKEEEKEIKKGTFKPEIRTVQVKNKVKKTEDGKEEEQAKDQTEDGEPIKEYVDQVQKFVNDCKKDCLIMKNALERYGITDKGPKVNRVKEIPLKDAPKEKDKEENMYVMNNPTDKEKNWVLKHIKTRLKNHPNENFLIVFVLAGHGMHDNGKQIVLLNEIKTNEGFYKYWGVEADIRDIASHYPNSYSMAFFACCRELKQAAKHIGGISIKEASKQILEKFEAMSDEGEEGVRKKLAQAKKKEADDIFAERAKQLEAQDERDKAYALIKEQKIKELKEAKADGSYLEKTEEEKEEMESAARGDTKVDLNMQRQNYVFFFGCRTDEGVKADTVMIDDLATVFLDNFERNSDFSITFPSALNSLQGTDVNFEGITSNTLQQLKLFYDDTIATKLRCIILVNGTIHKKKETYKYRDAFEKGRRMQRLFEDEFEFEQVNLYGNMPKTEIVAVFKNMQEYVDKFEAKEAIKLKRKLEDKHNQNAEKYRPGTCVVAVVSIGFILEKKSPFYLDKLVKNVKARYKPPKISEDDLSAFYDKTFNITREGKLLAISDYACKFAQGPNTHVIQIDDYSEDQQLWINSNPKLQKAIVYPKEDFPEMGLKVRPGRFRYTYIPKCNTPQLYKYFKDARKKEKRRQFQIPFHFEKAKAHIEKFRVNEEEDNNKEENEHKDNMLNDRYKVGDLTWKEMKDKNVMAKKLHELENEKWYQLLDMYQQRPIVIALIAAQEKQNKELGKDEPLKDTKYIKIKIYTQEVKLQDVILDIRQNKARKLERKCKKTATYHQGKWNEQPELMKNFEIPDLNFKPSVHTLEKGDQVLMIRGTGKMAEVLFTFYDNKHPYEIIHEFIVYKYADFYEAGAMLLEDNRPLIEQSRKDDYDICFLYHSEVPIQSTVPFTIMKMKYESDFLSDDTKVQYHYIGEKNWKEVKSEVCYDIAQAGIFNSKTKPQKEKWCAQLGKTDEKGDLIVTGKPMKDMKPPLLGCQNKDEKAKYEEEEEYGDAETELLKLARAQRKQRNSEALKQPLFSYCRYSEDTVVNDVRPSTLLETLGQPEVYETTWGVIRERVMKIEFHKNTAKYQWEPLMECLATRIPFSEKCGQNGDENTRDFLPQLTDFDIELYKALQEEQHKQKERTFGKYNETQPLYYTIDEHQVRVSKSYSEKFLNAYWKYEDSRNEIVVFTSNAIKVFENPPLLTQEELKDGGKQEQIKMINQIFYYDTIKIIKTMHCASAACKPKKYRKSGDYYDQEFVLLAHNIMEPEVTAIYGEPEDSDDEFDYFSGKKKLKAIMSHKEDDDQKMFNRTPYVDKSKNGTVDNEDGNDVIVDWAKNMMQKNFGQEKTEEELEQAKLDDNKIIKNGQIFENSYLGDGLMSEEFGHVALFKGYFNLEELDSKENKAYKHKSDYLIMNERIWYAQECDEDTVIVMLKPSDILVISNWRYSRRIIDPQSGNDMKKFLTPLPGPDLKNLPFLISSGKESLNLVSGERKKMQQLIIGTAMPLIGQQGVSYTGVKCTNKAHYTGNDVEMIYHLKHRVTEQGELLLRQFDKKGKPIKTEVLDENKKPVLDKYGIPKQDYVTYIQGGHVLSKVDQMPQNPDKFTGGPKVTGDPREKLQDHQALKGKPIKKYIGNKNDASLMTDGKKKDEFALDAPVPGAQEYARYSTTGDVMLKDGEMVKFEDRDTSNIMSKDKDENGNYYEITTDIVNTIPIDTTQCRTEFTMDFITTITDPNNVITLYWYRMPFHADFGNYIKEFDRLPYDSVEESMIAHGYKDKEMQKIIERLVMTKMSHNLLERRNENLLAENELLRHPERKQKKKEVMHCTIF